MWSIIGQNSGLLSLSMKKCSKSGWGYEGINDIMIFIRTLYNLKFIITTTTWLHSAPKLRHYHLNLAHRERMNGLQPPELIDANQKITLFVSEEYNTFSVILVVNSHIVSREVARGTGRRHVTRFRYCNTVTKQSNHLHASWM